MAADIALIVLAAGNSTRMGGPNKLLMDWRGKPLIRHSVARLEDVHVSRRIFVTGRDPVEVVTAAQLKQDWEVRHNGDAVTGLASSLKLGLSALDKGHLALVVLGDMPDVSTAVFHALIDAWVPSAYAIVPVYKGSWGNPVLLGADAISDCSALLGDRGARGLLSEHRNACIEVATTCSGILFDIDTAADLHN